MILGILGRGPTLGDDFFGFGIIFRPFFGMSSGNSHGHLGVCHFAEESVESARPRRVASALVPSVLVQLVLVASVVVLALFRMIFSWMLCTPVHFYLELFVLLLNAGF